MKITFQYILYCYRHAHKTFSGRLALFMMLFAVSILLSPDVGTLYQMNEIQKGLLVILILVGSGGEMIAPTTRMKIFFASPLIFYLGYGVFISLFYLQRYSGTSIFIYLLYEVFVGLRRRD